MWRRRLALSARSCGWATRPRRTSLPAEPAFGDDWSGIEITIPDSNYGEYVTRPRLEPDDRVIGVERDGEARAYPLAILDWHEVVNDQFDGPLLVTYCPLCASGVIIERRVASKQTIFGVSGLLYNSDLVLYDDATDSLWSQIMATAIRGPATGEAVDGPHERTTLRPATDRSPMF